MSRNASGDATFIASQQRMLRMAERDHALTPTAIELETGISKSTVKAWKAGTSAISGPLLVELAKCMPNHLMSLLFEPAGKSLIDTDEHDSDIDALAEEAAGVVFEISQARRRGPIDHQARASIGDRARRVASAAQAVGR